MIERRPKNLWRYRELLPITGEPQTGFHSGFTPLVRCTRLAERLGLSELYIKDDSVNHPTLSYKDRVVSVAATRAKELGFEVLACASTGNLANSVSRACRASRDGVLRLHSRQPRSRASCLGSAIFGPTILAIAGNYDDVNRLCTQVADRYGWGFVNINLRSYYAEGAKTMGFEIVEQLGWRYPDASRLAGRRRHAAAADRARPARVASRSASWTANCRTIHAAQAAGCAPVVNAHPRRASTIPSRSSRTRSRSRSRSATLPTAIRSCRRVQATGGTGAAVTDDADRRRDPAAGAKPKASSPSRPAARRSPATIDLVQTRRDRPRRIGRRLRHGQRLQDGGGGRGKLNEPVRLSRAFKEFEAWWDRQQQLVNSSVVSKLLRPL